jgi:L-lysine 2,3-aminomutase
LFSLVRSATFFETFSHLTGHDRAQFTAVGSEQQFQSKDITQMVNYIKDNPDISDVLITGGDPMVMRTAQLARYIDAILAEPGCDHLAVIRIGTKSLS